MTKNFHGELSKMKRHYQEISKYGPGGRKCACCGPVDEFKQKFDRMVKRRERRRAKREINTEILDYFAVV